MLCYKRIFYRNGCLVRSGCFSAQWLTFAYPTLYYKGIHVCSKIIALLSGTLSKTLKLHWFFCFFSPRHVDVTRVQLSSTDDQRQFITLRVHHCLQHVERDARRRAVRMRRLRLHRAVVQQFTSWYRASRGPSAIFEPFFCLPNFFLCPSIRLF